MMRILIAGLMVLATVCAASAADKGWTGVYIGGQAGAALKADVDLAENGVFNGASSYEAKGWIAGVHFGGLKQFGNLVVGVDLSIDGARLNGDTGSCVGIVNATCETDVTWLATGMARLGYASGRWLVFGQGGYSFAGAEHSISTAINNINNGTSEVAGGFAYGLGASYQIAEKMFVTLDWRRHDLKSDGAGLLLGGAVTSGDRDVLLDVVQGRISLKF